LVAALQRRFRCDSAQARRVHDTALALHRDVAPDAGSDEHRELAWACALHEMGRSVSHHDYDRHSAYPMEHVDAAGFLQGQQRRIAELILAQRGRLKKWKPRWRGAPSHARSCACAWPPFAVAPGTTCTARDCASTRGTPAATRCAGSPATSPLHLLREKVALWEQHGCFELHIDQG
jgi:exopolyphosphatase/guanosine-5'-triphosphate,3'-diphosphate pyrophosphatase